MLALHGKKNYAPLICLRPSLACASGALERMRFSRHVIQYRSQSNKYPHTIALRLRPLRDCTPNPPAVIDALSMISSTIKSSAPRSLLLKFLRSLKLFFVLCFFFSTPTNSQTNSRDYCMPISTASAIWRVHNHAQRRHLFNLPNLSPFTPSLPGGLEPQTYHERKTLPSVFFSLLLSPWVSRLLIYD
jgi:hypothetical protein